MACPQAVWREVVRLDPLRGAKVAVTVSNGGNVCRSCDLIGSGIGEGKFVSVWRGHGWWCWLTGDGARTSDRAQSSSHPVSG